MIVVVTSGASTIRLIVQKRFLRLARASAELQVGPPLIAWQLPWPTGGERGRVMVGRPLRMLKVGGGHYLTFVVLSVWALKLRATHVGRKHLQFS